jgi:hypothetical protein
MAKALLEAACQAMLTECRESRLDAEPSAGTCFDTSGAQAPDDLRSMIIDQRLMSCSPPCWSIPSLHYQEMLKDLETKCDVNSWQQEHRGARLLVVRAAERQSYTLTL